MDITKVMLIIIQVAVILSVIALPIVAFMYIRSRMRVQKDQVSPEEMDQIHLRLAEMDALQGRLMEIEERLDFAERLLGQRNDPVRLDDVRTEARHLTPV